MDFVPRCIVTFGSESELKLGGNPYFGGMFVGLISTFESSLRDNIILSLEQFRDEVEQLGFSACTVHWDEHNFARKQVSSNLLKTIFYCLWVNITL